MAAKETTLRDSEDRPVLGIDLGTTFSKIACWNDRRRMPVYYVLAGGEKELQSAVYHNPERDEWIVGQLAFKKGLVYPENLALGFKRQMDDASIRIPLGGKELSPIELSAKVLESLYKQVAARSPKGKFQGRGTVVTVPYYFKAHQCENTRKAADLANIECVGILQEPVAASLSYAWEFVENHPDEERAENILIYDLGGGTFDLTLFKLEQGKTRIRFEVMGTAGDDRLGGMDFDESLVRHVLERRGLAFPSDAREKRKAHQRLIEQVILTKVALSTESSYAVTVADFLPGEHIELDVTVGEFEACIGSYLDKIRDILAGLWIKAGIKGRDVDRVILVGGSSMIPCMKSLLTDVLGRDVAYHPRDCCMSVVEGAALYAAHLDDPELLGREIEVSTRTCHALGVEVAGGRFGPVIPSNCKTPCERKRLFTNTEDNINHLDIQVYQGSAQRVDGNSLIGAVSISDLPPRPKEELEIEVTFTVTEDQKLSVCVRVKARDEDASKWRVVTSVLRYN